MQRRSHARYHIINALAKSIAAKRYLEIGVRNPQDNFDRIEIPHKESVDPGVEAVTNHATHPMTSDQYFRSLDDGSIAPGGTFDIIFIDGLHLADQVYRDINHSLRWLSPVGFLVMHDCNPPTIDHARENFRDFGPAGGYWNGTSWKAFQRFRCEDDRRAFVVDVDWGVGVIVNHDRHPDHRLDATINPFYEYNVLDSNRDAILNLVAADDSPFLRDHLP